MSGGGRRGGGKGEKWMGGERRGRKGGKNGRGERRNKSRSNFFKEEIHRGGEPLPY